MVNKTGNILVVVLILIIVVCAIIAGFFVWQSKNQIKTPLTWEECIKTPGAINQLSYPEVCHLPNGQSVVQPLSEEEKQKLFPTPTPKPLETFCGGFAGKLCPSGYECQYDGNYPDASGKCVKTTPKNYRYICPESGWANCMPTIGAKNNDCTPEAMQWYKTNCPNFQGGAY